MIKSSKDLEDIRNGHIEKRKALPIIISVGMATCGIASGSQDVLSEVENLIQEKKIDASVFKTGCIGFCKEEPIVNILIPGRCLIALKSMTPPKIREILLGLDSLTIKKDDVMCTFNDSFDAEITSPTYDKLSEFIKSNNLPTENDIDFFKKQKKLVTKNCGVINPDSIDEYIMTGGYSALCKVLENMCPMDVIEEVKKSGIRGRGGAGFPTGIKWELCHKNHGEEKYIVCNADEGDPGAYMDRSILEGDPHALIEGMLLGAYAMNGTHGYIYVRTEYPLAIKRLEKAIDEARNYGLLGSDILNSEFSFDLEIREGSGAFVCGEETSLLFSIQGDPLEPRQRPPFPAVSGLWGAPTNINNVETWANIPVILKNGGEWFSKIGTERSKGTKVFSVVGKINNSGLVEVPMGIKLKDIVYEIGGGIPDGHKLKAVQTGGPSGGFIPANMTDLEVDYDGLQKVGSIMGSGGMVIMDDTTCIVDVAKFFLSFTTEESCGKCTSCRDGSMALLEILTRITEGKGNEDDIPLLDELCLTIKDASLCALGQTLPNPILSTIKYFKDEYEQHIIEKKCPACVCQNLFRYFIDPEKCQGCSLCKKNCPVNVIDGEKQIVHIIDQANCIKCGACFDVCPKKFNAVSKIPGDKVPEVKPGKKINKL